MPFVDALTGDQTNYTGFPVYSHGLCSLPNTSVASMANNLYWREYLGFITPSVSFAERRFIMKTIEEQSAFLKKIMDMLENHFGEIYDIVVEDMIRQTAGLQG